MKKLLIVFSAILLVAGCVMMAGCTGENPASNPSEEKPTTGAQAQAQAQTNNQPVAEPQYKDKFIMGYGKDPKLKGGKWGIGFFPKTQVLEKLVEYDMKNDEYVPSLAESWEFKDGGKTIVFHLKKGIKFSDGTEFDANAVKFTMYRLIVKKHSLAP